MNGEQEQTGKRIEVVTAEATALDPDKKYLILLDNAAVSKEQGYQLKHELESMGINHTVGMLVDGDPATAVQIVEV
jgi:hypothetical protein